MGSIGPERRRIEVLPAKRPSTPPAPAKPDTPTQPVPAPEPAPSR